MSNYRIAQATSRGFSYQARLLCFAAALGACQLAHAWVLTIPAGTRTVYLGVGNSTPNANNATVNLVTTTLLAADVGSGVAKLMTSNSTQANSPFDNFAVCTPATNQVYVGGFYRMPGASATSAVLQVATLANLVSGANSIPFGQISWTSTSIGNGGAADIPAGNFVTGGTRFLRNIGANTFVENCHTFSYANAAPVASGTYTGVATYTLTAP